MTAIRRAMWVVVLVALIAALRTREHVPVESCCPSDAAIPAGLTYAQEIPLVWLNGDWESAPKGSVTGKLSFSRKRPKQPIVVYLIRNGGELTASPPESVPIRQKGAEFNPGFAVLQVGQAAEFVNDEEKAVDHNVYTVGTVEADLGIFQPGTSVKHVFTKAGEVFMHCSIHKFMDGRLFIAPNPAYTVVGAKEDTFEIQGVPAGEYTLHTYQKAKRFHDAKMTITITEGQATEIDVEMKR